MEDIYSKFVILSLHCAFFAGRSIQLGRLRGGPQSWLLYCWQGNAQCVCVCARLSAIARELLCAQATTGRMEARVHPSFFVLHLKTFLLESTALLEEFADPPPEMSWDPALKKFVLHEALLLFVYSWGFDFGFVWPLAGFHSSCWPCAWAFQRGAPVAWSPEEFLFESCFAGSLEDPVPVEDAGPESEALYMFLLLFHGWSICCECFKFRFVWMITVNTMHREFSHNITIYIEITVRALVRAG